MKPDLRKLDVFSTLKDDEIKRMEGISQSVRFSRRENIFSEGDSPDWFYAVLSGKVKVTKISQDGKEIILELIQSGKLFGAVAVLNGFPYPANAIAMEDSEILRISRSELTRALDEHPNILRCLMKDLGDRLKGSHERSKNIALEKVGSRIASLLLKLADENGQDTPDGVAITTKLTKQEIAEMVGTTVETSIRTMSKLKKQGLIAEKDGRIIIKNPSALVDFN